jgi:hypothetical protein
MEDFFLLLLRGWEMGWTGWMVLQYTEDYTWGIVQSHLQGMNQV